MDHKEKLREVAYKLYTTINYIFTAILPLTQKFKLFLEEHQKIQWWLISEEKNLQPMYSLKRILGFLFTFYIGLRRRTKVGLFYFLKLIGGLFIH